MTAWERQRDRDRRRKRIASRQKDRVRRSLLLIPDPPAKK